MNEVKQVEKTVEPLKSNKYWNNVVFSQFFNSSISDGSCVVFVDLLGLLKDWMNCWIVEITGKKILKCWNDEGSSKKKKWKQQLTIQKKICRGKNRRKELETVLVCCLCSFCGALGGMKEGWTFFKKVLI